MKQSALFLLLLTPLTVWGTCTNKINRSRVILFIDTNQSSIEIASAQKAACLRGERLEVVPSNYKEYASLEKAIALANRTAETCYKTLRKNCDSEQNAQDDASAKLRLFASKQENLDSQIKSKLYELDQQNVKLTNISISGHDGGGNFHGTKGGYSRVELSKDIIKYPQLNAVESVMLMGCYTGVQSEVKAWRDIFPKLKIVAGYDGSAPNSERLAGHRYLEDILVKEKQLLKINSASSVDSEMKKMVTTLGQVNSAISINPACSSEDGNSFYYASNLGRRFNKMDPKVCEEGIRKLETYSTKYHDYFSGELEPPTDTTNGELRKIYNLIRTYEHCLDETDTRVDFSSHQIFNLLFWHGLKRNFGEFYKDDMKEAEKILKDLSAASMLENLEQQITKKEAEKKSKEDELILLTKDPEQHLKNLQTEVDKLSKKSKDLEESPEWKRLLLASESRTHVASKADVRLFEEKNRAEAALELQKFSLALFQENKTEYIKELEMKIEFLESDASQARNYKVNLQKDPSTAPQIWVPTRANLEKRSRLKVMENMSDMHELLSVRALTQKQRSAVNFIIESTTSHFQYLDNPFDWHEYRGRPEAPPYPQKLEDFQLVEEE